MTKSNRDSRVAKPSAEDLVEQTGIFMKDCDDILSKISSDTGVPDNGLLPAAPAIPSDQSSFSVDKIDQQSSTLLTLCNRYGGILTQCLKGLTQNQREWFFELIDDMQENVMATAFALALQEDISDRQRLIATRFGIENILSFRKGNEPSPESTGESSVVFLNLCDALGGLLSQCVNELSAGDRQLFLNEIDNVRDNSLLASFNLALEEGLSEKERKQSVHRGIRNVLSAIDQHPPVETTDEDLPAFLEVFDRCGGLVIRYINRLPDQDQEKFFEAITYMDKEEVESTFGPALVDGLLDMQRAPILEAVIKKVLGYAPGPMMPDIE